MSRAKPLSILLVLLGALPASGAPVHTTYLWHLHQPIYWPERSTWNGAATETAYETIVLGHSQNDEFSIFNSDDRVHDYQDYPKSAIASVLHVPDAGAQVSFAGSLIQNVASLAAAGWNGGRYASNWYQPFRDTHAWETSGGRTRLDLVLVAFHHSINPLVDEAVLRKMIQTQKAIMPGVWGDPALSAGFFPAEMCFSERMIPVLASEGIEWSIVPDIHIARACANYPYVASQDNCDPPNPADKVNPAQSFYTAQSISRGVTMKVPVPYALRPHHAEHVDPATGAVSRIVVVPAANAMSWNEGYSLYGTGEIDAVASMNDPSKPMLVLFAHDGDNAWSGGHSYYNENVAQFCNAAVSRGYEPTTVAEYLADHPVDPADVVHVEDGGWVNADGDFGSPQFINWNWPLVDASGDFDIPGGWAEDERNWAVLTAAVNRVATAEQIAGPSSAARIADPLLPGTTALEKAWHFLLAGHESGYMYYGTSLDMEVKPSIAANRAVEHADPIVASGADLTPPTIWIPQRLPWNPGGTGGGALWGYPGGSGTAMSADFHVWTFVDDASGVAWVRLRYREDTDGVNATGSTHNETYAGGSEVGSWQTLVMNQRAFPAGDVHNDPAIDFFVMPEHIADEYWIEMTGFSDVMLDYYVEAEDTQGNLARSPIQHVYVGTGDGGGEPVTWEPESPEAGETITISYDLSLGALPPATNPVRIHIGHSGWAQVLSPDPAMTLNAGRWHYSYAIPPQATSVDFVFTDGQGSWDNNSGADWHVPVSGAHVMDGALDAGVPQVGSCGGASLHADYDGRWLYLAAPTGQAAGLDRFLFVSESASGTRAAPWAKAGSVATFDRLLGNESTNGWAGWFDAAGALTTAGLSFATGPYLEGLVDAEAVWGTAPASVRIAFGAYATQDGGALSLQVACDDGDGNIEGVEWIVVAAPSLAAPDLVLPGRLRILSGNPSRGRILATALGASSVEVLDAQGRLLATFPYGREIAWEGNAAGVFFLRARFEGRTEAERVIFLPR